jgi:polysaccharide deacetylase family protein (PEP-CTERM system associated)
MTQPASPSNSRRQPVVNALSVDVEDYFQVQAFEGCVEPSAWDSYPSRVERNTDALLQIWDEAGVKATFFTLGWVAERQPALVRRIVDAGHELASHGLRHARVDRETAESFREDIRRSKQILEDVGGAAVQGYRAATFSMGETTTPWAWRVLEEEGFTYSSSIYPVKRDFYSNADAPRGPYRPIGADKLVEIPISTVRIGKRNLPAGGGGYFRFLPYGLSRAAINRVNQTENVPAVFYIHPWEVDPEQPRPEGASAKSRFRHYLNLHKTGDRLRRLSRDFAWGRMDEVFAPVLSGATSHDRAA